MHLFSAGYGGQFQRRPVAYLRHLPFGGTESLEWFRDYLSGRTQQVQVGDSLSRPYAVTSGILQGSCAGPLLFLAFINDIVDVIPPDVNCYLFADDVKLSSGSAASLQRALSCVEDWAAAWQLSFSPSKCKTLQVARRPIDPPPVLTLCGQPLESVALMRDLGVLVASDLSFSQHIDKVIRSASAAGYNILKCFTSGRLLVMSRAYKVYVRPHLESFTPVWSPSTKAQSIAIEKVQRRFTRHVFQRCQIQPVPGYDERLEILGLERLDARRDRIDLLLAHQIYHSSPCHPLHNLFQRHKPREGLRPSHRIIVDPQPNLARKTFFTHRVAPRWNLLDHDVAMLSFSAFRAKLSK